MKKKYISYLMLAVLAVGFTGCVKNYADPARATQDDVNTSTKGLTGVAVSLQSRYVAGRGNVYNTITASGFLTNELFLVNPGNSAEAQLGGIQVPLDGGNTVMANLWSNSNKIIYDADFVISNAKAIEDKALASGLIGYTTIFKALALGDLAAFWEKVPAGTGDNVTFISRADAYTKIVAEIDLALANITTTPISTAFLGTIPAGIDIPNTLRALKARYALYGGNYPLALSTANTVDLTKKSTFQHNATINQNGIFVAVTGTNNLWQPIDNTLGLPAGLTPTTGDKRIPFYMTENTTVAPRWRMAGFATALTSEWPVYLPGEVTLIKAEAYARQATPDITNALAEVNKIVTKKPAADPLGVGADLPALTGTFTAPQILLEIYKQRSIEMAISGQRFEDSRRLGRPVSERRGRNFMDYPFRERDQNPNTPADPAN